MDCAGIESPGLSASPAIGLEVAALVRDILHLAENPDFDPLPQGDPRPQDPLLRGAGRPDPGTSRLRADRLPVRDGDRGEILDAIHRVPGARSLDGVKRRTRAGMGRCQAGFCSPRVLEILARELGLPAEAITKCGGDSRLILGTNKDTL